MQRFIRVYLSFGLLAITCAAAPAWAQKGVPPTSVSIGGHAMPSDHDIVDNLSQSADHTVFVGLLHLAGMMPALQDHGPFTVFAPTNGAFAALPAGMLDTLRRPENKAGLVALLSMQILQGNFSSARLRYILRGAKAPVDLDTVSDAKIGLTFNGPSNLVLRDPKGNVADILIYDAKQSNGVVFVTDRVLQPG